MHVIDTIKLNTLTINSESVIELEFIIYFDYAQLVSSGNCNRCFIMV